MLMTTLVLTACAGGQRRAEAPPPEPAWEDTKAGPVFPAWLGLTAEQEPEVAALLERAKRAGEPLLFAGEGVARALASSARRCDVNDVTFLELRLEGLVAAGQNTWKVVIDAVNELHALLTPEQRRAVSAYLLERNERNRSQRRSPDRGSIGDAQQKMGLDLDLTFAQITKLLLRLNSLRGTYEDKTEPWLGHYRAAVAAFAQDDFDLREQPVAKAPIFEIARDLTLQAYTQVITIFDDAQCEAIGTFIQRKLDERAREQEEDAAEQRASERKAAEQAHDEPPPGAADPDVVGP